MTAAPLARLFRIDDDQRRRLVTGMLERHHTEAPSYWTQLVLAVGIATFGLVLNSGAVIIGAMLVAPLMGPIVELAMGLAVGSALLALRSALRIAISVVVAVLAAGVLTRALPFHEVTAEVAARTSPTVLDLMVACFCALTAAFVTMKPHDNVTTAAGTSIGISLVPPLCASGFGLGIHTLSVTRGALLLFTANLSAILLFALLAFLMAGFGSVDSATIEQAVIRDLERKGVVVRAATRLNTLLGSRHATVFKLLLPVGLVGAVFVPLQQALSTVSAEVQARQKLSTILNESADLKDALLTTIGYDQGGLSVRLVVLGDPAHAKDLEQRLRQRVRDSIGPGAAVSVIGVPDAAAVARLAAAAQPPLPAPLLTPPPVTPLAELRGRITSALERHYPEREAGTLLRWSLSTRDEVVELRLSHLGRPLGDVGRRLLSDALAEPLHGPVEIADDPLPEDPQPVPDAQALAVSAAVLQSRLASFPALRLCVEVPAPSPSARSVETASPSGGRARSVGTAFKPADKAAIAAAIGIPADNVTEGKAWSTRVSKSPCAPPAPAEPPASSEPAPPPAVPAPPPPSGSGASTRSAPN